MASTKVVTFRTDLQKVDQLDALASSMRWDRSDLINQALDTYLDIYQWQMKHIEKGLDQVQQGQVKDEAEWSKTFELLKAA